MMLCERLGVENADAQLEMVMALKKMREDKKYTREYIAKTTGLKFCEVVDFESGMTNPKMSTIRRYAKAVNAKISITVEEYIPNG